uniref:Small ribosomal subunit protein uS3c n=1 Tax=Uronema confervicola TaxID=764120 RepID=A0A6H1U824_9CHLO|nr:ribosomal protein S3 [Uronema confervicola]QIZ74183.1 ribosomal protein S3 [Uronema confervicola]
MGQKIHPYGYRVGITQPHSARWFANSYQYPQYVFEDFLLRQSLFKDLPVENLPRKRSDDKSETKLVQIKIERLIRNTIKIKLYMTSPENFSELFEQNTSSKFLKKDNGNLNQTKTKTNKDANLLFLSIQKKLLNKRIVQLKLLKLKNMQYKFLTMQNLIDTKATNDSSNKFFPSLNLVSHTQNLELSNSYSSVSLISGIKELLNEAQTTSMLSKQSFKLKYLFYFIQLKIKFFKNVDSQINFYQNLQKQKLLTSNTSNQTTITLQLKKLKALQQQVKTLLQYLNTTIETVKEKLLLQVEKFTANFIANKISKETYLEKCSTLINILKIKFLLQKNQLSHLESSIMNEKITEIKLRWFENLNSANSSKLTELKIQFQKQKLLTILTKFKVSLKFSNFKIEKLKKFIASTLLILAKVTSSEKFKNGTLVSTNLNEVKIILAKSLLIINKFDNCFCKNFKSLKERLISKINSLSILQENLKENLSVRKILSLVEDSSLENLTVKFPLLSKYFLTIVNSSLNAGMLKTNQNLVLDGFNNNFGKYTFFLKNKVINSNLVLLSSFVENKSFSNVNNYLYCLKKEYLSNSIQSIGGLKTHLKATNLSTKLYKLSLNLLTQRYNLNKILEIKVKSLLVSNKFQTMKIFNNYLKTNTLIIKQLVNWVTILKKKLTENSSTNLQLLQTRIYKINCYLKKLLNQSSISESKKLNESNSKLSLKIEKNLIFLNYNILKQKLISELLQMQRSQILSKNMNQINLAVEANVVAQKLSLQSNKLQKRILELETQFKQEKNDGELSLEAQTQMSISNTLALKTQLQELLKQNYQNNFIVLQSRRKVYNAVINRFGGRRNPHFTTNTTWKTPFEINGNQSLLWDNIEVGDTLANNATSSDKNALVSLLDAVKQKIYERKPSKLRETRKQTFLAKKTIKKKLKQFLIFLALQNNNSNLASIKNIYNVETLSKVCENLTTLQTLPKVSVIELVKVRQPKQYAVCLANFIVENLEKRFSFRSTMKKAAEQAMSTANVKGIKIQISGRLNGAEIARTEWLRDGVVPLQTLRANIDYSYKTAKTIYGILGIKVWLFKDSSL